MATVVLPEHTRALYPFKSHYLTLSDGKKLHYLDEGPPDGEVLVFLHGYPTWSFAFRAFLIYFAAQGYRCIAFDHIGYGFSDKPTGRRYHTLRRHIYNVIEIITTLNLTRVTLIMEDWGGPFGLGYAIRSRDRVRRLVLMNTWGFQDTLENRLEPLVRIAQAPGIGEFLFGTLNIALNVILQYETNVRLSRSVLDGYRTPFKDRRDRTALVQFPRMINTGPQHRSAALMREIEQVLPRLNPIPTLILWGEEDVIFGEHVAHHWKQRLPHAHGPYIIPRANHLLVEDASEQSIQHIMRFLEATSR